MYKKKICWQNTMRWILQKITNTFRRKLYVCSICILWLIWLSNRVKCIFIANDRFLSWTREEGICYAEEHAFKMHFSEWKLYILRRMKGCVSSRRKYSADNAIKYFSYIFRFLFGKMLIEWAINKWAWSSSLLVEKTRMLADCLKLCF